MFREWGFLISEMIVLIVLAALLGVFVGWLIWGRKTADSSAHIGGDRDSLQSKLSDCQAAQSRKDARISELEAELAAQNGAEKLGKANGAASESASEARSEGTISVAEGAARQEEASVSGEDYDGDGVVEGKNEGSKPETMDAARDGKPDDLKQIKGIGPKLEQLCFKLGFFHFDQIASWTPDEVAWVDANLDGFRGRVSRDNWIDQARILAGGGNTEFSKKVEGGGVY